MKLKFLFFVVVIFSLNARAQEIVDLVEKTVSSESEEASEVTAKKEIQEEAIHKATGDILKDLIGNERFSKNLALIQNKIYRHWNKYIPYIKNNEIVQKDKKFSMTVQMKISVANLRSLLKIHGLLIEESSTPVFIPLVTFVDRVNGQQFQWWRLDPSREVTFLSAQNQKFEKKLGQAFFKSGLQMIEPYARKHYEQIPFVFQNEKWTLEDATFLTLYFQANVILDGQIIIDKNPDQKDSYRVDMRIAALQVSNGRYLAELQRKFDTDKGVFAAVIDKKLAETIDALASDLSTQVYDVWQRGSIGASLIRMALRGKLSPLNQEGLKEKLKSNIAQIKNIKERLISTDQIIYEIDTTSSSKELAQKILELKIQGFQLNKINETDKEISFQITGG